jgi:hypothetical protein
VLLSIRRFSVPNFPQDEKREREEEEIISEGRDSHRSVAAVLPSACPRLSFPSLRWSGMSCADGRGRRSDAATADSESNVDDVHATSLTVCDDGLRGTVDGADVLVHRWNVVSMRSARHVVDVLIQRSTSPTAPKTPHPTNFRYVASLFILSLRMAVVLPRSTATTRCKLKRRAFHFSSSRAVVRTTPAMFDDLGRFNPVTSSLGQ